MSIFTSIRNLNNAAQTLSSVAVDSADDVTLTASQMRFAAHKVGDAAESVKDLADIVKGLVLAVAIGWTVGTLIRAVWDLVDGVASDPFKVPNLGKLPGLDKQTLGR